MKKVSDKTILYLKKKEGFSPVWARCPAGILTIGHGHAFKTGDRFPSGISKEEAEILLRKDVSVAEKFANDLEYSWMNQYQFEALVSLVFNCGRAKFLSFKYLPEALQKRNEESIKKNWLDIVHAGGKKLPGLVKRRKEEYEHGFEGIEWDVAG